MTVYNEKSKRRVVPRWRSSSIAASAKEFQPLRLRTLPRGESDNVLVDLLAQFEEAPNLGVAAEVLTTASRIGQLDRASSAARFITERESESPRMLISAAATVLNGDAPVLLENSTLTHAESITQLRQLLGARPRNPALWVDLSWHQASLGDVDKAQKSMRVAVSLAPEHRWVLRAASRLLLHSGELEEAHKLLATNPRTKHDPWLISAELASAQISGRSPRFVKQGQNLVRAKSMKPVHLSELAAALATIELEGGGIRFARRLMKQALLDPTENALAQIEWANRESHSGLALESTLRRTPRAYEATTWIKYKEERIDESLAAAMKWLNDEPFADRPPAMVCYLASFLDNYQLMAQIAGEASRRHPTEALHRNNLAFAQISSGQVFSEGTPHLADTLLFLKRSLTETDRDLTQTIANIGLLMYRADDLDEGKKMYEEAINYAEKRGNFIASALASIFAAREAILCRAGWAAHALDSAHKTARRVTSPGIAFYLRKLDVLAQNPHDASKILSPNAAARFQPRKPSRPLSELRTIITPTGPVLVVPPELLKHDP